jgi:hypothetical protein
MDVTKILEELKREREQIEEAILTLERLAEGRGKRRGRPPSWLVEARKRGKIPQGSATAAAAAVLARASNGKLKAEI